MTIRRDLVPPAPPPAAVDPVVPIEYATVDGAASYTLSGTNGSVISDPGAGWTIGYQRPSLGNSGRLIDLGPVSAIPGALECIDSDGRLALLTEIQDPPSGDAYFGLALGESEESLMPLAAFGRRAAGGYAQYAEVSFSGSNFSFSGREDGTYLNQAGVGVLTLDAAISGARSRTAWIALAGDFNATTEQLDPTGATVPILPPVYRSPLDLQGQGPDNGAGPGSRTATTELHLYLYVFTQGAAFCRARVQMQRLRGPISPYSPP